MQQQQHAAASAARPLARSVLAVRSSPLSPGGIAGAVIGSVVGALLIAFCVFPFIVRARRRHLARHDDPSLAEMGQSPGGPILAPHDIDDSSSKRYSKDHLVSGTASGLENGTPSDHHPPVTATDHEIPSTATPDQKPPQSTFPQGVALENGLPSPISPPLSPTSGADSPSHRDSPPVSPGAAASPGQSPTDTSSQSRYGSKGTVGRDRESTRELSLTDSYGPPSRQVTAITSAGITEEPETFDGASDSTEQGHFPHLKESLRNFIHRRHSSQQRRDSRRSTTLSGTDGARSPSIITNEVLPQADPTPSGLEIDIETPGLAWDYYHDPTLGLELADYSQSTPTPTSATIAPSAYAPTSVPFGSVFPTDQAFASSVVPRPADSSDFVSFDSDKTSTPTAFSRQSTFLPGRIPPGPLQRTDSLPPPTIVSDIPSPPLLQYNIGPSGNPMEMMRPTNSTESAWMLEHEMKMIQNSPPPPPTFDSVPAMSAPVDVPYAMSEMELKPDYQASYQSAYQSPYQSPPQLTLEVETQMYQDPVDYYNPNMLTTSDYSTPPPSTGPSTENTPNTMLTPYTASPSPPSDLDAVNMGYLSVSPGPSQGLSPAPSPAPSPGQSPGRAGPFVCKDCGTVKQTLYEFNHHQRYHKRPFACYYAGCDRSFGTVTHMKRHVNDRHEKTRKFYCTQPDCPWSKRGGKSFPRKDNWRRHMKNKHHIDPDAGPDSDYTGEVVMGEE